MISVDVASSKLMNDVDLSDNEYFKLENGNGKMVIVQHATVVPGVHVGLGHGIGPFLWWRMRMAEGNEGYFYLESGADPNYVLTVAGQNPKPIAGVTVYRRWDPPKDHQLFRLNGATIESRLNSDWVLDVIDDDGYNFLIIANRRQEDENDCTQCWKVIALNEMGNISNYRMIENRKNKNILHLIGNKPNANWSVGIWPKPATKGLPGFIWFLQPYKDDYFYVVSGFHQKLVLTVQNSNTPVGSELVLELITDPPSDDQLFRWNGPTIETRLQNGLVWGLEEGARVRLLNSTWDGDPASNCIQCWSVISE